MDPAAILFPSTIVNGQPLDTDDHRLRVAIHHSIILPLTESALVATNVGYGYPIFIPGMDAVTVTLLAHQEAAYTYTDPVRLSPTVPDHGFCDGEIYKSTDEPDHPHPHAAARIV
jgi:hypothetical protein